MDDPTKRTQTNDAIRLQSIENQPATPVNNDHSLNDVATNNQLGRTKQALVKEKTKRRSKPLLVFLLGLLVAALGAVAGIAVYKAYFEKPAPAPVTNTSTTPQQVSSTNAQATIAAVTSKLNMPSPTTDKPLLALQVAGYDFKTDVNDAMAYKGVKADVPASDVSVKVAELGKLLKEKGFSETISAANDKSNYESRYFGADAACLVKSQGSPDNAQAAHVVSAYCLNMDSFKVVAAAQKPFHAASKASITYNDMNALYGKPDTKPSQTSGYTLASLVVGAANAGAGISTLLFYQTPDKAWHFVTSKPDVGPSPLCSDFSSTDAKMAYVGTACLDSAGKSAKVSP